MTSALDPKSSETELAQSLLTEYLQSMEHHRATHTDWWNHRDGHSVVARVNAGSRALQAHFVEVALREAQRCFALTGREHTRGMWSSDDPEIDRREDALRAAAPFLRRQLPFSVAQLEVLAESYDKGLISGHVTSYPIFSQFERRIATAPLSGTLRDFLLKWRQDLSPSYREDRVKLQSQLSRILGSLGLESSETPAPCSPGQAADALAAEMLRAAEAYQVKKPFCPKFTFSVADLLAGSDSDRLWILWRAVGYWRQRWARPNLVHPAQFLLDRPGFSDFRRSAPDLAAVGTALLSSVVNLPDRELFEQLHRPYREWPTSREEPVPDDPCQWPLQECLYLGGLASPGLLELCRQAVIRRNDGSDCRWWGRHLEPIEDLTNAPYELVLRPGDAWANAAIRDLRRMPPPRRAPWLVLLRHCDNHHWSRPPRKWLDAAKPLVDAIPTRDFQRLCDWLALAGARGSRTRSLYGWPFDPTIMGYGNGRLLRAIIFAASLRPSASLAAAFADAAIACDQTALHIGPRCAVVRNAAIAALALIPPPLAAPHLARLDQLLKYKASRKLGSGAVQSAASASNTDRDVFLESHVPDFGLNDGAISLKVGPASATISLDGAGTRLTWTHRGRRTAEPPEALGPRHSDDVANVKRQAREIGRLLVAHRLRLERLLVADRAWPIDAFRARYCDHPLLADMSRRLIWRLDDHEILWNRDHWENVRGRSVTVRTGSTVRPWHPALSPETVGHWRRRLERLGICQPFKQAHREIYLLTDAERRTETYSNRFAAHILRSKQLLRLLRERGWQGNPATAFDDVCDPHLALRHHALRAHWHLDQVEEPTGGIVELLSSDRVYFTPVDSDEPIPLERIPPLAFSEVMRDVDLSAAVCSIGADPQWLDGGRRAQMQAAQRAYWTEFNFGELTAIAAMRRDFLARTLPRLKIAPQCTLADRFLRVQGKLRAHKIHLGSGNILMEPNDQYLCIVPTIRDESGPATHGVFLPFEGDRTLSIILSKAFMLAADDQIKDPSITRQIGVRR